MTYDEGRSTTGVSNTDFTATPHRYDWAAFGRPSTAIVEGVADATGRNPADVSLSDCDVDSEALDALMTSGGDGRDVSVSLTLDDAEVTVDSDGTLEVTPDAADPGPGVARVGSDSELNERLKRVLDAAFESEVDVLGGWVIRNGPGFPDWDVHVTETTKPRDDGTS